MLEQIAKNAKNASYQLASLSTSLKNQALELVAKNIDDGKSQIMSANVLDLEEAKKMVESGEITQAAYNRLKLDENKMRDMVAGIRDVAKLADPVNNILSETELDAGLILQKVSTPLGVVGVIFEARPDVVPQISALAIKSANAVILKGGREAQRTNTVLAKLINDALSRVNGFPRDVINLIFTRDDVKKMLEMDKYIDLIIPRGGNSLVRYIKDNTRIPVLGHADGICHIFVDESADLEKAKRICIDAKVQYPSACNSVETILIHKNFEYKDELKAALINAGIDLRESPESYAVEYGEKTVALKDVDCVNAAIEHINQYSSHHTDAIVTENKSNAELFMNLVDSAGVFRNTSTRFSDGFRYGLGAEVGISTNKTHARGPVGLEGLTIYKYKLRGNGEIVDDYCTQKSTFHHKKLK